MRRLTERAMADAYLTKANGDANKALRLAVRDMGRMGYCLSAGFVRAAPYGKMQPPHDEPPSVDIPEPDTDE
jgi:hypothetical protein